MVEFTAYATAAADWQPHSQIPKGQLLIGGEWVNAQAGETMEVLDPTTEAVITQVQEASALDANLAIGTAHAAFEDGPWSKMRYEDRAKILFKVADLMDERADDDFAIREAMGKDEAIRLANDTDYGLASGIQTSDLGRALRIAGNSVYFKTLQSEAHRAGDQVGIPLAGDDPQALELAARLVRDAGFEPIVVGPLVSARSFDAGTPVYNTGMSGAQLARALGVVRSSSIPELQK
jgi:hypothetical protein